MSPERIDALCGSRGMINDYLAKLLGYKVEVGSLAKTVRSEGDATKAKGFLEELMVVLESEGNSYFCHMGKNAVSRSYQGLCGQFGL